MSKFTKLNKKEIKNIIDFLKKRSVSHKVAKKDLFLFLCLLELPLPLSKFKFCKINFIENFVEYKLNKYYVSKEFIDFASYFNWKMPEINTDYASKRLIILGKKIGIKLSILRIRNKIFNRYLKNNENKFKCKYYWNSKKQKERIKNRIKNYKLKISILEKKLNLINFDLATQEQHILE